MKEKRAGIYCIENLIDGKKYVGQGQDVEKRMWQYHTNCYALNNSIQKYGKENFSRKIIVYCEYGELERLEIECIKIFHSHVSEWGYNISWGGDAPMRGRKHSEKTKNLMSDAQLGKHLPEETRKLMSIAKSGENHPMWGKHPSDETRNLMSENHSDVSGENNPMWGKTHSDEAKKLISDAQSGENHPMWGKPRPEKVKQSISDSLKGEKCYIYGKKRKNSSSQYFGVYIKTGSYKNGVQQWVMLVRNELGKRIAFRTFCSEIDAALAYDKCVIENNIKRPLNFPDIAS